MPTRPSRHTPTASTSAVTLPPRFTVPPLPPVVHRRLALYLHNDYLLITPLLEPEDSHKTNTNVGDDEARQVKGVKIGWGVKGGVEPWEGSIETTEEALELGGILGLVRLWDGRSSLFSDCPSCCARLTSSSCIPLDLAPLS